MKVKRGYAGEDRSTTHWERQAHGWTHYIWIDPYYVEWGSHCGTPQSDASRRILHDRLLEGEHFPVHGLLSFRTGSSSPSGQAKFRAAEMSPGGGRALGPPAPPWSPFAVLVATRDEATAQDSRSRLR